MRALAVLVILALCALARGKSSRCIMISDAWREPRPNTTQQTMVAGKVFYDSSIPRCTAFGQQCEEWIEFRAERGQVHCIHQKSHAQFYMDYWDQMNARLALWVRGHGNALQTVTHAIAVKTLDTADADSNRQTADAESLPPALHPNTDDILSSGEEDALVHEHLHESTTPWTEPPEPNNAWRDSKCDAHKTRPIRCRMVAKKTLSKIREQPYMRRPQSIGWMRNLFHWECETTPKWIHIMEPGPVCPPFFHTDSNVCIPVEECAVFIDVDGSRPFSALYMSVFITALCAGSLAWVMFLYRRKIREKRALAVMIAQRREEEEKRAFPFAGMNRHASRGGSMFLASSVVYWLLDRTNRAVRRDQEQQQPAPEPQTVSSPSQSSLPETLYKQQ